MKMIKMIKDELPNPAWPLMNKNGECFRAFTILPVCIPGYLCGRLVAAAPVWWPDYAAMNQSNRLPPSTDNENESGSLE
jgi:hypothetical protein